MVNIPLFIGFQPSIVQDLATTSSPWAQHHDDFSIRTLSNCIDSSDLEVVLRLLGMGPPYSLMAIPCYVAEYDDRPIAATTLNIINIYIYPFNQYVVILSIYPLSFISLNFVPCSHETCQGAAWAAWISSGLPVTRPRCPRCRLRLQVVDSGFAAGLDQRCQSLGGLQVAKMGRSTR